MLVQFSVENFLSFGEMENFSLRATKDKRQASHVWTNVDGRGGKAGGVLRGAAIYGANASGKSNLVRAISHARQMIINGADAGETLLYKPFKLQVAKATQPTRFEFYFRSQDVLYSYGFAFDATRVHEEWLFATVKKNEARYFERTTNEKGEVTVEFGPSLRGAIADEARARELKGASTRADNLAADTRANQLFLSACAERNVAAVAPIMHWFEEILEIISAESPFEPLVLFAHVDRDFAAFVGDFLRDAGTGIERVETEGQELDFERHFPGISAEERSELETHFAQIEPESGAIWRDSNGKRLAVSRDSQEQLQWVSFWTLHRGEGGKMVRFRLEEESDGTQRLFDLVPTFFVRRKYPKVWIIDELDRRLHTNLTRLLVEHAFDCPQEQPCGQFVFTTHDTHLLDLNLLRRDEIWLVEKGEDGASRLATLAEWRLAGLKVRPDLDIETGYRRGRFGAVPLIKRPTRASQAATESELAEPELAEPELAEPEPELAEPELAEVRA